MSSDRRFRWTPAQRLSTGSMREIGLLCVLGATILYFWSPLTPRTPPAGDPALTASSHFTSARTPVPVVKKRDPANPDSTSSSLPRRNPFKFTDEPPKVETPPPPPPPPPEIKPESRFLGTLDEGELHALFGLKGDVIPLKEGDTLEGKYLVKRIDPDSVLLEDATYHNVMVFSMVKK